MDTKYLLHLPLLYLNFKITFRHEGKGTIKMDGSDGLLGWSNRIVQLDGPIGSSDWIEEQRVQDLKKKIMMSITKIYYLYIMYIQKWYVCPVIHQLTQNICYTCLYSTSIRWSNRIVRLNWGAESSRFEEEKNMMSITTIYWLYIMYI